MIVWTSDQKTLTASEPTLITQGMDLERIEGFRVILSCPEGKTFSLATGSPKLLYYLWSAVLGRWVLNPSLSRTLTTADATGGRDFAIEDTPTFVPFGRLYVAQSGLTVSSGTVIEGLHVEGWKR